MKAKPWSFTALEQADNCLKQYDAVRNQKLYPFEANTPEAAWGRFVHKAFEDRQGTKTPLPQELKMHEPFMLRMEGWKGENFFTEQQVALDRQLQPCSSQAWDTVWWRGVIDYVKLEQTDNRAKVVDYKTGKRKPKPRQLAENACWVFAAHPDVQIVDAFFYWTQEAMAGIADPVDRYVYTRDQVEQLWADHVPSLTNLREAFRTNTWPAKKSGLCKAWCPVLDCEHNGKNPNKR